MDKIKNKDLTLQESVEYKINKVDKNDSENSKHAEEQLWNNRLESYSRFITFLKTEGCKSLTKSLREIGCEINDEKITEIVGRHTELIADALLGSEDSIQAQIVVLNHLVFEGLTEELIEGKLKDSFDILRSLSVEPHVARHLLSKIVEANNPQLQISVNAPEEVNEVFAYVT